MYLKILIKQRMKELNLTPADVAIRTGIPYPRLCATLSALENVSGHIANIEKIMFNLGLFEFDDEQVNEAMKAEAKKLEKTKYDYIY